jgi:mannose-6-phosphate isomerase-like protein (cupin superfamily)
VSVSQRNRLGAIVVTAAVLVPLAFAGQEAAAPRAKLVQINPLATESVPLLSGPPETVTMRSGSIVLLPSKNVGKHSTGDNEEVLVVFSGSGEMRMANGTILSLKPYVVAYCPPDTEHDVFNTGSEPLRYVYLVARAR